MLWHGDITAADDDNIAHAAVNLAHQLIAIRAGADAVELKVFPGNPHLSKVDHLRRLAAGYAPTRRLCGWRLQSRYR